jgi:flagellar hook-length control protein FliK
MLQTSPSSSDTGVLPLDVSSGSVSAGDRVSGDGFSKTLEKQMDRVIEKRQANKEREARQGADEARDTTVHEASSGQARTTANEAADEASMGSEPLPGPEGGKELAAIEPQSAELVAEDGNNLPPIISVAAFQMDGEAIPGVEKTAKELFANTRFEKQQRQDELVRSHLAERQTEKESVANAVRSELNKTVLNSDSQEPDTQLSELFVSRLKELREAIPAGVRGENAKEGGLPFGRLVAAGQATARSALDISTPLATGTGSVNSPVLTPVNAATAVAPSLETLTLQHPVSQKGWDQAMGERVVWMVRQNVTQAQIQLNPRELGPIEIRVSLNQEQASVNFTAHHATTREALEAAIPRLRDMLGEQGFNLVQADVSERFLQQQADHRNGPADDMTDSSEAALEGIDDTVLVGQTTLPDGAVDYYA